MESSKELSVYVCPVVLVLSCFEFFGIGMFLMRLSHLTDFETPGKYKVERRLGYGNRGLSAASHRFGKNTYRL